MIAANLIPFREGSSRTDRNQVQLSLAVATKEKLQSLLANCVPAIAHPHQIGQVRITVGAPPTVKGVESIDAILEYEHVWCVLSAEAANINACDSRDYQYLTRCQSNLKTLACRVKLSEAIALLRHGGFHEDQIQRILQLPWDGWYRSWWDTFDNQGQLSFPFQRWFRTRGYSDGTYTLQYRDHYPQDAPTCFRGVWQRVPLMMIQPGNQFGEMLTCLRTAQHALKTQRCLLLADALTDLEAEAYMRQGISLYPLQQSVVTEHTWNHQRSQNARPDELYSGGCESRREESPNIGIAGRDVWSGK